NPKRIRAFLSPRDGRRVKNPDCSLVANEDGRVRDIVKCRPTVPDSDTHRDRPAPTMKIMFVVYSMTAGGAQRVAAVLLNHWVNAGDELSLVTIASSETDFYQLDSRVRRVTLDLGRASRTWRESVANNFRIIMGLRAFMREAQPDVLLSFIDLVNLRVL